MENKIKYSIAILIIIITSIITYWYFNPIDLPPDIWESIVSSNNRFKGKY